MAHPRVIALAESLERHARQLLFGKLIVRVYRDVEVDVRNGEVVGYAWLGDAPKVTVEQVRKQESLVE